MLHAELAGKIAPDADDMTRREDVMTSTVFGTLFLANAWPSLMRWMERAHPVGHGAALAAPVGVTEGGYWFWPRLREAEPDIVIRFGSTLLVVEAKYLSGKSGGTVIEPTAVNATDQLVREWRSCSKDVDTSGYPRDLCDAIAGCDLHLIYLVRRARWARELRAVEESTTQVEGARMYLLSWEDLDDVLASHEGRWARELRAYLHRRGVAAFRGFASTLRAMESKGAGWYRNVQRTSGLRWALTTGHREAAARLATSPLRFQHPTPSASWSRIAADLDPDLLSRLAARPATFGS